MERDGIQKDEGIDRDRNKSDKTGNGRHRDGKRNIWQKMKETDEYLLDGRKVDQVRCDV